MFLTFTYFTFYGMVAIGLTPSQQMAAVVSSAFYSLWNLLAGFLVPKPVTNISLSEHFFNVITVIWCIVILICYIVCSKYRDGGFGFTTSAQLHGLCKVSSALNLLMWKHRSWDLVSKEP